MSKPEKIVSAFDKRFQPRHVTPAADGWGPIPAWAWIFVLLCWLPALYATRALPIAIAALGSFACTNIARDAAQPLSTRVRNAALIVLAGWTAFALLFGLMLYLQANVKSQPLTPPRKTTVQK